MSTWEQRRAFNEELFGSGRFLDDAIAWICTHLSPDDVFKSEELEQWAENNGWIRAPQERR